MSRTKKQISFAKKMAFLIKAGIPIIESLLILHDHTQSKKQQKMLNSLINDISHGHNLSKSMTKFPQHFSTFSVNVIRVGESNGTLSQNFHYLAEELKKSHVLKQKLISALVYPVIIVLATICLTALLTIYIFPKVMPIFGGLNITLPLSTRIMLFVSNFLIHYGVWLIVVLVLLIIIFYLSVKKSPKLRLFFDRFILKIPLAGQLSQFYNLAAISRTLGLLLKSGARISESLPIVEGTTSHRMYKKILFSLSSAIHRGEKISTFIKHHKKLFPELFGQMIAVGESSGSLSDTFIYLSEYYDNEIEEKTKNLSNLLEPILMIVMGVIVSFVAIAVISPIYSITEHLHPH